MNSNTSLIGTDNAALTTSTEATSEKGKRVKKVSFKPGYLFLHRNPPAPYTPDNRFRVIKATRKGHFDAVSHAKEKGKATFSVKLTDMIWVPPVTRDAYRATKKAAKASQTTELAVTEPEVTTEGVVLES